ncbi:uncharacterized protein KY384_008462 [Bacidia gigantensis]|uniref:uncharacterized protein n=1 Tax=Bacidia gigantensis TaxID=2732470 RepID=UPI001D0439DA|nr:uncharacterized protein KY384_008462 [Bacidia gigantensis]KAG8527033.1 hypothetical protein KY384_008462 [Bacidia gigantensis]
MVKSYLKFEHSKTFGLVVSASANVVWCPDEDANAASRISGGGRAIVGADEEVLCWHLKKGELISRWKDPACSATVTAITRSKTDPDLFAVGYTDGSVRLWDSRTASIVINFNGHKSAISTLQFDVDGVRLASGSKDTDIVIWDLVAEVGLFKLRGHTDQITGLHFLNVDSRPLTNGHGLNSEIAIDISSASHQSSTTFLLSTGKDALLKLWDINAQHCIETHVAQSHGECWAMGVSPDDSGLITAGNEGELRTWSIDLEGLSKSSNDASETTTKQYLRERGVFYRQGKDRTTGIHFHANGRFVIGHGAEKAVEVWRIRSGDEIRKVLLRKRKRRREKLALSNENAHVGDQNDKIESIDEIAQAEVQDVIVPYVIVRTGGKVRSVCWANQKSHKHLQFLTAEINNQLEVWTIPITSPEKSTKSSEAPNYDRTLAIDIPGHRTDVRALATSSDDRMLASASNGALKVWNLRTNNCIRTLDCGYALCTAFLPGDKIVVVGNRDGELEMFDIASSSLLDTVKAHDGPIWTMHVHPDGRSLATGSADKSAKFYNFEVVQEEIPGTRRSTPKFKLIHIRTLKVTDDVLSIRYSPDARLVALALLDNTVKIFFTDSLKLFLNLYGHKLPVLNMDISFDSKLIVTCSADKNVRLWGLDFGDCHKAFFAHQDSILQVTFVPHNNDGNGHHFFSASKDKRIKYWDGDKFEQIQKLDGHHGEIWAMAVSHTGAFLVSASHDKSIRVWNQTDEQVFLEEEREKELEELYESTLTTSLEKEEETSEERPEAVAAGKQTIDTLMAGEKIAEALEVGIEDLRIMQDYHTAKGTQPGLAPPQRDPIYLAYHNVSAEMHLLNTVQKIQASALQDALLVLSFDKISSLLVFLQIWADRQWNMPLTCRILSFMLRTHHKQIVASKQMRSLLDNIREKIRKALESQKDEMGFNLAALRFVGRSIRETGRNDFIDETLFEEPDLSKSKKKRGFVDVA